MKLTLLVLFLHTVLLTGYCQNQNDLLGRYLPKVEYRFNGPVSEVTVYKYNSRKSAKWLSKNSKKEDRTKEIVFKYDENGRLINSQSKTFYKIDSSDYEIKSRNYSWENNIKYDSLNRVILINGVDHLNPNQNWNRVEYDYAGDSIVHYKVQDTERISAGYKVLNLDGNVEFSLKKYGDDFSVNKRYEYSGELLIKEETYFKGELANTREYEYYNNGNLKSSKLYGTNYSGTYQTNYSYDLANSGCVEVFQFGPEWKDRKSKIYRFYDELGNVIKVIDGTLWNKLWDVYEYEIKYKE